MAQQPHTYPAAEERLNIISHAMGLVLSVIGLGFLIAKAVTYGTLVHTVSFAVFGTSLVVLYAASTLYHSAINIRTRKVLQIVDHASIYLLIAGTYTPFVLVTLQGVVGWVIFGITWSMALAGIVTKIFFTGRFDRWSTAMYVLMGWIIVFAIKPLAAKLSPEGLAWTAAGGISYTVGALFYSVRKLPYGHATFHVFVLLGSACHFVSVYFFILTPGSS